MDKKFILQELYNLNNIPLLKKQASSVDRLLYHIKDSFIELDHRAIFSVLNAELKAYNDFLDTHCSVLKSIKLKYGLDDITVIELIESLVYKNKNQLIDLIKIDPHNLKDGSEELKNDFEVVRVAIEKNGMTLMYASEELRDNKELVMIAVRQYSNAIYSASLRLQNDMDVIRINSKKDDDLPF